MGEDITVEARTLRTDDGEQLEAELAWPADPTAPWVVLCHPHPLHGGDMRSLVISELFRILPRARVRVARFNFRGVGRSTGSHGGGVDEQLDIRAAIETASGEPRPSPATNAPPTNDPAPNDSPSDDGVVLVGWSFGADVSLAVDHPLVRSWVAIAPPLRIIEPSSMVAARDDRPKLLIVPEHDQFDPPDRARGVTEHWVSTDLEVVAGADHFLVGRTDRVAALVTAHVLGADRP